MKDTYDFIVLGAGISACTFASFINKRFSDASILLIENGRRLGGRATTRISKKNKNLEFDHGLPSISFSSNISQDIMSIISPLIDSKKLVDISNDILIVDEFGSLNNLFIKDKIYRSFPFMINFSEEIINQSINPKKINFLFKTLTKSIYRARDIWNVQVNKGRFLKSKYLILSSSLIAHPRCLRILGTTSLPLRNAFKQGQDNIVDSVIEQTRKITYIKRKVYILYVSNHAVIYDFKYKYLQIFFSKVIKDHFNFEKLIFQTQSDGSMVLTLHCVCENNFINTNPYDIINTLGSLFTRYPSFSDLILESQLINIMDWRASQPLKNLLSRELQWSSTSKIGFCGDWFSWKNCGGVESAMKSSIRLSQLLS